MKRCINFHPVQHIKKCYLFILLIKHMQKMRKKWKKDEEHNARTEGIE